MKWIVRLVMLGLTILAFLFWQSSGFDMDIYGFCGMCLIAAWVEVERLLLGKDILKDP